MATMSGRGGDAVAFEATTNMDLDQIDDEMAVAAPHEPKVTVGLSLDAAGSGKVGRLSAGWMGM